MPESVPPAEYEHLNLAEIAKLVAEQKIPPVERWNPTHCGDSEMRIASDGTWYHQGSPIGRPAMVRLFSSILRREPDGRFVLVTPAEKLDIIVEDAPFLAVSVRSEGEGATRKLAFQLNTGDLVVADGAHPVRCDNRADGPHPYVTVRGGLDALISRPVYYELAQIAIDEGNDPVGLWSHGHFFSFEASA